MIRTSASAALAALLGATALTAPAAAQDVGSIVFFGDSLSDPGNIPGSTGGFDFPPAPYVDNHFSNGPTFAEQLPGILDLDASDVLNFAHGGAFTGQLPTPAALTGVLGPTTGNINTITQAPNPGLSALFGLDDTDVLTQVGGYLASSPTIADNDFFSVYGGANDYFLAAGAIAMLDPMDPGFSAAVNAIVTDSVTNAVTNLGTAVGALEQAGGANFIVPNLPDLGQTPANNTTPEGQVLGRTITDAHNGALYGAMADLGAATGATIYVVDVLGLTADMQANPAKYGLTNVTEACVDVLACVTGTTAEQNAFLFFDSVHPTTAVHGFAAALVADTIAAPRTLGAQAETGSENAQEGLRRLSSAYQAARRSGAESAYVFADLSRYTAERDGEFAAFGHEYEGDTLTLGFAAPLGEQWRFGGAVGFTQGSTEIMGDYAGFDFDSVRIGGFAGFEQGIFSAHAAAQVTTDTYDEIFRETGIAGQIAAGKTTGESWGASLEGRATFALGEAFEVAPLARVRAASIKVDGYEERGATAANLLVLKREVEPLDGEFGAELSGDAGAMWWRLEGVFVESMDDDDHVASSALASIPNVVRHMDVMGTDGSYGRITGAASFNLGGMNLEIGGETITGSDNQDAWGAYGRLGKTF